MDTQVSETAPRDRNPLESRTRDECKQLANIVAQLDPKDKQFVAKELFGYARYSITCVDSLKDEQSLTAPGIREFITRRTAYWNFQQALLDGTWTSGRTIASYETPTTT
jgi:hypothetical protein